MRGLRAQAAVIVALALAVGLCLCSAKTQVRLIAPHHEQAIYSHKQEEDLVLIWEGENDRPEGQGDQYNIVLNDQKMGAATPRRGSMTLNIKPGSYDLALVPGFDSGAAPARIKFSLQPWPPRQPGPHTVMSYHIAHDSSMAISIDGQVRHVLELERLFDERYFEPSMDVPVFYQQMSYALRALCTVVGLPPNNFDQAVIIDDPVKTSFGIQILSMVANAREWIRKDHHHSHAAVGFYDSPFDTAIVFSIDAGGNDGTFNIYECSRANGVVLLEKLDYNMGTVYSILSSLVPEVAGSFSVTDHRTRANSPEFLALPGKAMAYASLGRVRRNWLRLFEVIYREYSRSDVTIQKFPVANMRRSLGLELGQPISTEAAKDIAATSQVAFENVILEVIKGTLAARPSTEGLILTGGCALNVVLNQKVRDIWGPKMHVPSAPGDNGLTVGAIWLVTPPKHFINLAYAGTLVWDFNDIPRLAQERGATQIGVEGLVAALAGDKIVGVVRGYAEYGPRSLGHRSLLCYPDSETKKDRLNKLKYRAWYRPVAPVVAVEALQATMVKPDAALSRYMSFAPALTVQAARDLPTVTHFDGTARVQTVSASDEPWLHAVLLGIMKARGYGVLANTSFNSRGHPILNLAKTALELLDSTPELDHVLLEDWLVPKKM